MSYHENKRNPKHDDGNELSNILETVQKYIESIARKKGGSQAYQREVRELKRKLQQSRGSLERYGMGYYFRDNRIQRMDKMSRDAVLELLRQIENDLNQRISKQEDGGDNNCDGCPLKECCEILRYDDALVIELIFAVALVLKDPEAMNIVNENPHMTLKLALMLTMLEIEHGIIIVP